MIYVTILILTSLASSILVFSNAAGLNNFHVVTGLSIGAIAFQMVSE